MPINSFEICSDIRAYIMSKTIPNAQGETLTHQQYSPTSSSRIYNR